MRDQVGLFLLHIIGIEVKILHLSSLFTRTENQHALSHYDRSVHIVLFP